jgi:hypothetical protein
MKLNKLIGIIGLIGVLGVFGGCSKDKGSFVLEGECDILTLTLDEQYTGVIDMAKKTVVVAVPENYDEQLMTVTDIQLSVGATTDLKKGDKLNLLSPRQIVVTNGKVFQNFTLSVKHDAAYILGFVVNGEFVGVINEKLKTITVQVPKGTDLAHLVPTVTTTEGATVTPASGVACDFTNPVTFTVTYGTASTSYVATVKEMGAPKAIYIGIAPTQQQLNLEEQTACAWLLSTVEDAMYISFADFAAGQVDLSQCKVIWWHFHKDGGIEGKGQFETNGSDAILAIDKLKAYYNNGGSFLLTRYATYLPAYLGEADCVPNNCWGQNEDNAETINEPWSFGIQGKTDHALWQNLVMKSDEPERVFTCDKGYRITNSTAQYHIGTDWGGYADNADWRNKTGAIDIAYGDKAIVAWEYPSNGVHGGIICIGSGCYDWYTIAEGVTEYYHENVAKMTENAINYLSK